MTLYEKYERAREEYLASLKLKTKSEETYEKYSFVINDFGAYVKAHGEEQAEVPPVFIVGWLQDIKAARALANNSVRYYTDVLHSFFRWTIEHKIFSEQPINKSDKPKKETIEYDFLTEQEIEKILSGKIPPDSMHATSVRNRALVILVLTGGLRVSELINLRVGDLDFKERVITVRHGKGDKKRFVTLPEIAERYVKEYLHDRYGTNGAPKTAFLFDYVGDDGKAHRFTRQNVTRLIKSYVYRLTGHKGIGTHDLRHSYASYMLTHGVPIQEIQALLGHESFSTTLIYARQLCPKRIAANLNGIFCGVS